MRDYVAHFPAERPEPRSTLGWIAGAFETLRERWSELKAARSGLSELRQMNDHQLRDIGLQRSDVEDVSSAMSSVRALEELERRAYTRR